MKSGKRHMTDGMELPNHDRIRTLEENETYKYLGILEADTIKQVQMKGMIRKEYLRRTWKLLETRIIKGPGGFGSWQPSGDHPNNSIIENGQNTEKSPGDLRRLAVTQSPVKDHQLTLMWKTLMSNNNNNYKNNNS